MRSVADGGEAGRQLDGDQGGAAGERAVACGGDGERGRRATLATARSMASSIHASSLPKAPPPTHVRYTVTRLPRRSASTVTVATLTAATLTMAVLTMATRTMATPAAVQRQHGAYEQRGLVGCLEG